MDRTREFCEISQLSFPPRRSRLPAPGAHPFLALSGRLRQQLRACLGGAGRLRLEQLQDFQDTFKTVERDAAGFAQCGLPAELAEENIPGGPASPAARSVDLARRVAESRRLVANAITSSLNELLKDASLKLQKIEQIRLGRTELFDTTVSAASAGKTYGTLPTGEVGRSVVTGGGSSPAGGIAEDHEEHQLGSSFGSLGGSGGGESERLDQEAQALAQVYTPKQEQYTEAARKMTQILQMMQTINQHADSQVEMVDRIENATEEAIEHTEVGRSVASFLHGGATSVLRREAFSSRMSRSKVVFMSRGLSEACLVYFRVISRSTWKKKSGSCADGMLS